MTVFEREDESLKESLKKGSASIKKRKTFIIDTNVLIHDPDALVKFCHNDVVIPLSVLEELDSMKRLSDEGGKNARYVLRFIDSLKKKGKEDLHEGVNFGEGSTIRIHLEPKNPDRKNFPLSLDKMQNRILHAAHQMQADGRESVVLVSKDFVMRVKAESIGLEAEDYENLKMSYSNIYKGYRKLALPKEEIDLFYKEGKLKVEQNDFHPNEYVLLSSPENSSAICKYNRKGKVLEPLIKLHRDIWGIHPLNFEQKCALDLLLRDDVKLVTLLGQAGTGKTLLALSAALRKTFDEGVYNKILVSRPIIPLGKDIGYLPGTKEEKLIHWMQPIYDNLEFLCGVSSGKGNGQETQNWIMESKKLEMEAVTYIRGRSLPKTFMIIDEAQNLTPHEVKTIISRAGQGTKVILTGDPTQIDNPYLDKDSNALTFTVGRMKDHHLFGTVFLDRTERSDLAAAAVEVM